MNIFIKFLKLRTVGATVEFTVGSKPVKVGFLSSKKIHLYNRKIYLNSAFKQK
jgi:hypothetical protein